MRFDFESSERDPTATVAATMTMPVGVHYRNEDGRPFVVLAGRATVEPEGGDTLTYVHRGTVCTLPEMTTVKWVVSEPIEILAASEAIVVFKATEAGSSGDGAAAGVVSPARPFRPRRHLSGAP